MINYTVRINKLYAMTNPCHLCPHKCGVDRSSSQYGKCRTGRDISVSSYNLHYGEEPPISGYSGSGTIFFTNCNLSCVFCQNYPISQLGNGNKVSIKELAGIMIELQQKKAHNINFVTPSHVVPAIVEAVYEAKNLGLNIPLVYNCGGYESIETLAMLDGIIDIYMPDAKYSDPALAKTYSGASNYWEVNKAALAEMHRQVGNLCISSDGIASRGLLIRHLVLPNDISGSREVLDFIAKEISKDTYISMMSQYHPANHSGQMPELSRKITHKEYREVIKFAKMLGLDNGWQQEQ